MAQPTLPEQPKVFDAQTGEPLSVSPDQIPSLITSGKAAFMKGTQIPVLDSSGRPGTIPAEEAHTAFQQGYQYEPIASQQGRADKAQYGEGLGNELKAGAAGVARGLSLGLSDEALTHSGLVEPETLSKLRQYNPASSIGGQIAGAVAPILASGGTAAGAEAAEAAGSGLAALAPTTLAARLGTGVSEAVGSAVGSQAAKSLAGKIAATAVARGAGSAVEGALYGAGNVLTEHALGDTDMTAEKIAAQVGYGALFAGGIGSVLGAGEGALAYGSAKALAAKADAAATSPEVGAAAHAEPLSEAEMAKRYGAGETGGLALGNTQSLPQALKEAGVKEDAQQSVIQGMARRKENAGSIIDAAKKLDAPVLEGQISADTQVQRWDSLLTQSPSKVGVERQALYQEGIDKATQAASRSVGEGIDQSLAEVGDSLKASLSKKFQGEVEPISALYDELKQYHEAIPLSEKAISQVAGNIRKLEGVDVSPKAASMAEDFASRIEKLSSVDQLKRFKSVIRQEMAGLPSALEKRIVAQVSEKLSDLEENSIIRFAEQNMKTPEAKERILALIDQRAAANKAYKGLMDKIEQIKDVVGGRRITGPQDFLNYIDEVTPEKFAQRLFSKNNVRFLQWFEKSFPEETNLLMQYQRAAIREAATKNGEISAKAIFKQIDKLPKEVTQIMFKPHEREILDAARTYLESMPANINPSGTSMAEAYRRFISHPIAATAETAKDYAILKGIKTVVGDTGKVRPDPKIMGLVKMEQMVQKTTQTIKSAVQSFLKAVPGIEIPASVNFLEDATFSGKKWQRAPANRDDAFKKRFKEISDYASNPEALTDKIAENVKHLDGIAPNVSQNLVQTAIKGTQFLYEKAPKNPYGGFSLSSAAKNWKPSDTDMAKWERYAAAVDNPMSVFKDLKNGRISTEAVEALQAVYPKLHQEMVSEITDALTEHKGDIPYQKRLQLSMALSMPLDETATPQFISQMQANLGQTNQAMADQHRNAGSVPMGRASKIKSSEHAQTETERVLGRG